MLKERIISAIILIALVLVALFFFSPFFLALTLALVVSLGVWEWTQFAKIKTPIWRFLIATLVGAFLYLWVYGEANYLDVGKVFPNYAEPILLLSVIWWLVALSFVIKYPDSAKFWGKSPLLQFIFAFFTLIPFFVGLLRLRLEQYIQDPMHGITLLFYVFILVWSADSGAYFAGRKFGKHKLAPKVSPGKTWQGVMGGVCTATILAWVFLQYAPSVLTNSTISLPQFILLSIVTVLISILGDLTESMFKRESGIKDSSQLIPGHGGILDRIDSLTAAIPFFTYFYFFVF